MKYQFIAAHRPNEKWLTDITYIPTAEGGLYLAGVMDLYSRRIVGWAMSDSLERSFVIAACLWRLECASHHPAGCITRIGAVSRPAKIIRPC